MVTEYETEYLIFVSGMVIVFIAHQLFLRKITKEIICIDNKIKLGVHFSRRNSGILQDGLFYKPVKIKAKGCVNGEKKLRKWIEERNLPFNPFWKINEPQKNNLKNDFICKNKANTTYIQNAMSPAFTDFFELANYIIKNFIIK